MKAFRKYRFAAIATAALALLVAACEMVIEEINFPEDAKVNSEITVTVKVKLVTETDDNSQMVFAVLAPKSWNLKSNASLSLTTEGYAAQGYPEVIDEAMSLIPDSETEKSTALSYPMAYQSKIGLMGNTGPVEWTVFKSATTFHINDKVSTEPIYGTVTIRLTTGPDPIKFFMGFGFCGTTWGLDSESGEGRYTPNETAQVVTVYGEEGDPILDYTTTPAITAVPSTFRYGDIFSVNYDAAGTVLEGEENVYLCGKIVLSDGTSVEVTSASGNDNLMEKTGKTTYRKYIYPKSFFNLQEDAEMTAAYFWFVNSDGTVVDKEGEDGHLLDQSAE